MYYDETWDSQDTRYTYDSNGNLATAQEYNAIGTLWYEGQYSYEKAELPGTKICRDFLNLYFNLFR